MSEPVVLSPAEVKELARLMDAIDSGCVVSHMGVEKVMKAARAYLALVTEGDSE